MEFKETEMKLKGLCDKFKKDLQEEIKKKGHYGEGKLSNSIEFSFKKDKNKYTLQLEANQYIRYLDEGMFLKEFLNTKKKEMDEVLKKSVTKDIIKEIKK
jgi:hypothetical protein